MVNGARGGVGSFAVQLATAIGADITGVGSTRNLERVRALGASQVIDYTQTDFTRTGRRYDLIFDAVGNHSVADYQRALTPRGRCVVAGFTSLARLFQVIVLGAWVSRRGRQTIGLMPVARPNPPDLACLAELLASGRIAPLIDRCYPLEQAPEAIRYLETGHARGKVVITLAPSLT